MGLAARVTPLAEWQNFYVIVGSSAGALIGLQFVVMTLVADRPVAPTELLGKAFAAPTIVHFEAALLLSALVSVPWRGIHTAAVLWALLGVSGLVYMGIVTRRVRAQTGYKPEFEDWLFHVLLPFAAYATLAASGLAAHSHMDKALFGVAAAALLLLFDGIHNAWDSVAYHVFAKKDGEEKP